MSSSGPQMGLPGTHFFRALWRAVTKFQAKSVSFQEQICVRGAKMWDGVTLPRPPSSRN